MNLHFKSPLKAAVLLLPLSLSLQPVYAVEWAADLSVGGEHTDNALRSDLDKQSDTIYNAAVGFNLSSESRTFQSQIDYDVSYLDYANNTQQDETVLNGLALINWSPRPGTFEWEAFASSRNLQRNRRETDVQDNRETRNTFSTGPTLGLHLSSVDKLLLLPRYTVTRFEDTESSDNERASADFSWLHRFSPTRNFQLGTFYSEAEFDDAADTEIEFTNVYLAYESSLNNQTLMIRIGYNESERTALGVADDTGAPSAEIRFELTEANYAFTLNALHQLTDSTMGLSSTTSIDNDSFIEDTNFDVIDIIEQTSAVVGFTYNSFCTNCTATLTLSYSDEDYEIEPRDQTTGRARLSAEYISSPKLKYRLSYQFEEIDFDQDDRNDTIQTVRFTPTYTILPDLTLALFLEYGERSSDNVLVEYYEKAGGLSLRYNF